MVETEYTGGSSLIDRENGTRTPYVCTLPDRRSLGVERERRTLDGILLDNVTGNDLDIAS